MTENELNQSPMLHGLKFWINAAEKYKAERDEAQSDLAEFRSIFDRLQAEAIEREVVVERLTKLLNKFRYKKPDGTTITTLSINTE